MEVTCAMSLAARGNAPTRSTCYLECACGWDLLLACSSICASIVIVSQLYDGIEAGAQNELKGNPDAKTASSALQLLDDLRQRFVRLVRALQYLQPAGVQIYGPNRTKHA